MSQQLRPGGFLGSWLLRLLQHKTQKTRNKTNKLKFGFSSLSTWETWGLSCPLLSPGGDRLCAAAAAGVVVLLSGLNLEPSLTHSQHTSWSWMDVRLRLNTESLRLFPAQTHQAEAEKWACWVQTKYLKTHDHFYLNLKLLKTIKPNSQNSVHCVCVWL